MSGRRLSNRSSAISKREELRKKLQAREEKKANSVKKSKALSSRRAEELSIPERVDREPSETSSVTAGDDDAFHGSVNDSLEWDNSAEEPSFLTPHVPTGTDSGPIIVDESGLIDTSTGFPSRRNTSTDDNFLLGEEESTGVLNWPSRYPSQEEEEDQVNFTGLISNLERSGAFSTAMEEQTYKDRFKPVKIAANKTVFCQKQFTSANISELHTETFEVRLKEIRELLNAFQELSEDLIADLDENDDRQDTDK